MQFSLEKLAKKNLELNDMGTTIVIAIIANSKAYVYHAGDSRLYLYNETDGISQITLDHNLKNYANFISSYNKRTLVHALGPKKFSSFSELTSTCQLLPLKSGKKFTILLCTDGVYEFISETQIYSILKSTRQSKKKIEFILNLAEENNSVDNLTAAIIQNFPE